MDYSNYTDFKLYKKDVDTAKFEIRELERLLNQAKRQYKEVFDENYDNSWYIYLTNALSWLNPLNYVESKINFNLAYYIYADDSTFNEGYDMYSSVYGNMDSDFDISDDECNTLD